MLKPKLTLCGTSWKVILESFSHFSKPFIWCAQHKLFCCCRSILNKSHTIHLMREHCHLKMTNRARVFRMIFSKFWGTLETILNCQVRWICYCCIIKNARICSNNFTAYMPNSLKLIWTPLALDILRRAR